MIYAEHLRKEFQKIVKEPGLKGSFKALFKPKKEWIFLMRYLNSKVL